jgi:hypothetical protein
MALGSVAADLSSNRSFAMPILLWLLGIPLPIILLILFLR